MSLKNYLRFRLMTPNSRTLVVARNLHTIHAEVFNPLLPAIADDCVLRSSTQLKTSCGASILAIPWVSEEAFLRQVQESDLSFAHVVVYNPEQYIMPNYVSDALRQCGKDETTKIMRVYE